MANNTEPTSNELITMSASCCHSGNFRNPETTRLIPACTARSQHTPTRLASAEVMTRDRPDRRCRAPAALTMMVSRQAHRPPTTPGGADVTMKSVAVALAVVSAFALSGCEPAADQSSPDNTDDGRTTLLCHVANGWVSASPDGKSEAAKTVGSVIDDIAGNMDESSRAAQVLVAARQLLSDKSEDIAQGAAKIKELC
ncbi:MULTISPECIES: hypothetical protein [Saccharothrix]|uniref:hypothetical protein n=1 Tax=Saccharothrix TaxID=2071 RepID=UPI001F51E72A|nr:hypothetical protein [Saccharothrix sp. CB00851]